MDKALVALKAEWRNIILANYLVDPAILLPHVPAHTELDTYNNAHYISLAGFLFKDTHIKGMIMPFQRTFEGINLRFYVRYKEEGNWKRGVVFIKEIAPSKLAPLVAGKIFGKNHHTCDTRHMVSKPGPGKLSVEYMWNYNDNWNWMIAQGEDITRYIQPGSEEDFICEHYRRYGTGKKGTTEYLIEHPQWRMHNVHNYDIHCDFGAVFGPAFTALATTRPQSVLLADGSEVKMTGKKTLNKIAL